MDLIPVGLTLKIDVSKMRLIDAEKLQDRLRWFLHHIPSNEIDFGGGIHVNSDLRIDRQ